MRAPAPEEETHLPEVGERLGDFQLLGELGRGLAGRTFLAAQPSLADRPVVLKVMARDHDEHLSLARLQHTHIVPLYSEQAFPERGLRALCMPYLGGTSLARILDALALIPLPLRRGHDLLDALDSGEPPKVVNAPTQADRPFRGFLAEASYEQAVCWVVACLADALQYAHDRGLVHMDVKPANVLIAADGQPMLLDFHLARAPVESGAEPPARLGGTPGWVSPEQAEAMRAAFEGTGVTTRVDGRSDIHALGLLLAEALGGDHRADPSGKPLRLRHLNPTVSPSLAELVARCLGCDPADRYPRAADLADDLRRHLNDQPLRGAANRSLTERWQKWRRRRPLALTRALVALCLLAAVATVATMTRRSYQREIGELRQAESETRRLTTVHDYGEALRAAERGLSLARRLTHTEPLAAAIRAARDRAARAWRADELHELADRVRYASGSLLSPPESLRPLAPKLRQVWDERGALLPPGRESDALESDTRARVRLDLLELAIVWADLRVQFAPTEEREAARGEALGVLNQAEASFGPSPALRHEQRALRLGLGLSEPAADPGLTPTTPWEFADLGRFHLRAGRTAEAFAAFTQSLRGHPQDFWTNHYQGVSAYRLGDFETALAAFRACVTLAPDSAGSWVNRALAAEALGRFDDAYRDNCQALGLAPDLAAAYLNRGHLAHRAGRLDEAIADNRKVLTLRPDRPTAARARLNLALALLAGDDLDGARREAQRAADLGSEGARALLDSPRLSR